MGFLLDTHTVLWLIQGDTNLSDRARSIIESSDTKLYFSIASLWEISIKIGLGKLELDYSLQALTTLLHQLDIDILPISVADLEYYLKLPLHHRDPFDRILIAQAMHHALIIVSRDSVFAAYPVERLWA
jgi:PIN domain nuclease of toxin-antitoxin system